MALTYTPQAEIGSTLPEFSLPSVEGKNFGPSDFEDSIGKVFLFICNHCPYVKAIEDRILSLAHELSEKNIQFVAICSNDANEYPEDSLENLKKRWIEKNYGFPYLHDESQSVAKDFGAVCTPDIFVYDQNNQLYYRGRFDDSWKDANQVKNHELKSALLGLLEGAPPPTEQIPSMGCSIKWKSPS